MDISRINAMIIYNRIMKQRKQPTLTAVAFAEQLIQAMLNEGGAGAATTDARSAAGYRPKRVRTEMGAAMPALRLTHPSRHWPKKREKRSNCKWCWHNKDKRVATAIQCVFCEVPLCLNCFEDYHTQP